jgi:NAD(P)H-dependent FMN reductase
MIADRLSRLDLQRALPLVIVLGRMGTRAALLALAPIVAALDQDAISIPEQILFSVFDDLHRHLTEAPNEARQRILTEARALIAGQ